ncbi:MAG: CapA family protein, partial [Oscillospiraceae bacterium]|nr:CapA family protein [Oscillospiraceae bacterium]
VIMLSPIQYHILTNSYHQPQAKTLIDLGADLVLGGHPHVLEPYEFVTTEAGNTGFVCYSLGNFISSQVYEYTDTTVLLNLTLEKDPTTGETAVTDVSYVPFYMLNKGQKINGERMVLLDVYAAMAEYEGGDTSTVTDTVYANLQTALENCHTILGEEGDLQAQS